MTTKDKFDTGRKGDPEVLEGMEVVVWFPKYRFRFGRQMSPPSPSAFRIYQIHPLPFYSNGVNPESV